MQHGTRQRMSTGISAETGPRGLVFAVQKFSVHDGSGIRTIVFLKGCPLACRWCSNPEGRAAFPELMYARERCLGTDACPACLPACARAAIGCDADGRVDIDRARCDACGACANVCPSHALRMCGEWVTVDDVLQAVEEDGVFYARSGGGVTLSGGEPLAQPAFVTVLLAAARGRGLHTAIETSGLCRWSVLAAVAPLVDEVLYDVKCIDERTHLLATGVSNRRILDNFRRLRRHFPHLPVTVRTPVIPGVNDSEAVVQAIAEFVEGAGGAERYELLSYHRFGEGKYVQLGQHYALRGVEVPPEDRMRALRTAAARVRRESSDPAGVRSCDLGG